MKITGFIFLACFMGNNVLSAVLESIDGKGFRFQSNSIGRLFTQLIIINHEL